MVLSILEMASPFAEPSELVSASVGSKSTGWLTGDGLLVSSTAILVRRRWRELVSFAKAETLFPFASGLSS